MNAIVKDVLPGSPASKTIITKGDILRKINGNTINDVLDYKYRSYDSCLLIELTGAGGGIKLVRLRKPEGADVGMEFDTFLMDKERSCANKCIFCFIDQLPRGMRRSLYFKDDDVRLTFTNGNYVTLTNVGESDLARIVRYRLSPINVSVHTTDPALRARLLGRAHESSAVPDAPGLPAAPTVTDVPGLPVAPIATDAPGLPVAPQSADILPKLRYLTSSGIFVNAQIVLCRHYNDGAALDATLADLGALGDKLESVSVVPSGLTRHRSGLTPLEAFDTESARRVLRQVGAWQKKFLKVRGSRLVYAADELYTLCGRRTPGYAAYEGYPQLENGVGMLTLFERQFKNRLYRLKRLRYDSNYVSATATAESHATAADTAIAAATTDTAAADTAIAATSTATAESHATAAAVHSYILTGAAAAPTLDRCIRALTVAFPGLNITVTPVTNYFFGEQVTVAGLLTGSDIMGCVKKMKYPENSRFFISKTMLKHDSNVFLDDFTLEMLRNELKVDIIAVENDGCALIRELLKP